MGVRFGSANFAVAGSNQAAADAIAAAVAKDLSARTNLDTPIKLVIYKADANGDPTGGFTSCTANCYRYTWNGSGFTFDLSSPAWTNPAACIDPTNGLNALDAIVPTSSCVTATSRVPSDRARSSKSTRSVDSSHFR